MKRSEWERWPVRAPADGASGGGGDAAGGAAGGDAGSPPAGGAAPAGGADAPAARPDWAPETFWKDGRLDTEGLGKAYGELRTAFSSKEEKIREGVIAKLREGVPEKPDAYKLEIKKEWLPQGFEVKPMQDNNPLVQQARALVHEMGGKQEHFDKLTQMFVQWQATTWPDMKAEGAKLGEGGEQRIKAVDQWLSATLGNDDAAYRAMVNGLLTADAVRGLETVMKKLGGGSVPSAGGGTGSAALSPQKAAEFMAHPDYNHPVRGADMREQVSAFIRGGGRVSGYAPAR